MDIIKTIEWQGDRVVILDQRRLPREEVYNTYEDYLEVAHAIKSMVIRGAPAIGVAAAMGMALGSMGIGIDNFDDFFKKLSTIGDKLASTRPTAVNLFWAIERMKNAALANREREIPEIVEALKLEALKIYSEDIEANHMIGRNGEKLLSDGMSILTHCNAGALATAGFGTALGVIYTATDAGKRIHVYADETRPRLQGAMLTAWELQKHGIEVTVICDTMMGSLMRAGKINACIVGADRIARNGDVANKIGTYQVAVLAKHHKIPFYVAAPLSTIDMTIKNGYDIPIEERDPHEVTHINSTQITPDYVEICNPAFDVTPADLVSAIITERGIIKAPFESSLEKIFS